MGKYLNVPKDFSEIDLSTEKLDEVIPTGNESLEKEKDVTVTMSEKENSA